MDQKPKSGEFNSNRFAKLFLESIKEITGIHGLNTILNYAKLTELIENPPPDNLKKEFDFANISGIIHAMEEIYGERGGKGLALRIGKSSFVDLLDRYGETAGVGEMDFKLLPIQDKIKNGLEAMARIFNECSDQVSTVVEMDDHYCYKVKQCPICWGREEQEKPLCFYMVGLLQGGLSWVSGGKEYQVQEIKCIAQGHDACEFIINKNPIG